MNARARLERTLLGEAPDRVPVALWRHFPGDDQRSADLAYATVAWQRTYDWDFVKMTPASSFAVADYGVQDEWRGNTEGTRETVRRPISRSLDWTDLRPLDPTRGSLGRVVEATRLVCEALGDGVPVVAMVFSPLAQAKQLAGERQLVRHMRTYPDRLRSGLNALTETTLRLIDTLRRLPIAGIFYAVNMASYQILAEDEYRAFGIPYDLKLIESLPERWWLNFLHLHGELPMFRLFSSVPMQAVNWHDRGGEPSLEQAKPLFPGVLCGGVSQDEHLHFGTPTTVRDAAREAIQQTNGRRFILAGGCVTPVSAPLSNLRALREVAGA